MRLSKNFCLEEMTFSVTASNHGINNTPPEVAKMSLRRLAVEVLQPIRDAWGGPIVVTSGFRCPKLNAAVGGVKTSQHLLGQAADIRATNPKDNGKLFACIKKLVQSGKISVGQLIWEYGTKTNPRWIHVSSPTLEQNNQMLYYYSYGNADTKHQHQEGAGHP